MSTAVRNISSIQLRVHTWYTLYGAIKQADDYCTVPCESAAMFCIGGTAVAYSGAATFSGAAYSVRPWRPAHVAWWSRSSTAMMGLNDENIENSLRKRIGEISSANCPEKVTLLIQDAMVPRQRMYIQNAPASYVALLNAAQTQNTPLCMVGRHRTIHSHGVQVAVQAISSHADGTADVVLRGDRLMQVVEAEVCEGTWTRDLRRVGRPHAGREISSADAWVGRAARVQWLPLDAPDRGSQPSGALRDQIVRADRLSIAVAEWQRLVRGHGHEKFTGQLDSILESLGPMPDARAQPNERCMWVAALLNPYPKLGVANEMRPAALMAKNLAERLDVVEYALEDSIARLEVGWI